MPAYNKKQNQPTVEFIGYVNITLDDKAQKELKVWRSKLENIWDLLDEYAENAYRVSVAWDNTNNTYMCSITSSDPKAENAGYVLVGRGSSSFNAIAQAIYKDRIVAQNRWKEFSFARQQDWD